MKLLTRKQLPLYALSGFGPNFLMTIVTAYLIDALSTAGFVQNVESWTFANKTIVYMAVFSVLVTIAKIIDGVIDVPLAAMTDTLKTKWGKRRPSILIGFVPMVLTFVALCFPLSHQENSILNTVWIFLMLVLFFSSYTLCLVTYYGTFSEVTANIRDRSYLSYWKSFFDTIQYSIAYALIPLIVGFDINIQWIAIGSLPLMFTMLIPLFLLKEKSTLPADISAEDLAEEERKKAEEVPFFQSIKLSFGNRNFMIWMGVFSVFFFGLQMFLTGQNVLASGAMGLNGWQIAIINSAAFAPVPLMLFIYNKVMKRWGFRTAFQTAILSFALAMTFFAVANKNIISNEYIRLAIGATGSTIGSYGIGAFFSSPYIIPSHIAAEETKKTGKHHPSMYFAVQGLINAVVGALSTGVVWLNIKGITKGGDTTFGASLMPYIVIGACVIAFGLTFVLPKMFSRLGRTLKGLQQDDGDGTAGGEAPALQDVKPEQLDENLDEVLNEEVVENAEEKLDEAPQEVAEEQNDEAPQEA